MNTRNNMKALWRNLLDWLNKEEIPPFSLDPVHPGTLAPRMKEAGVISGESLQRPSPKSDTLDKSLDKNLDKNLGRNLGRNLDRNLNAVRKTLHTDECSDVMIREFLVAGRLRAALVFIDGMADRQTLNADILQPLVRIEHQKGSMRRIAAGDLERIFPVAFAKPEKSLNGLASGVMNGNAAVLVDGMDSALMVESRGYQERPVGEPKTERVVLGPHEAFVESLKVNVPLVRRILKTPNLICKRLEVGELTGTSVVIFYIKGITNERLVEEVERRVSSLRISYMGETAILDQLIDVPRFGPIPHALYTERPDRFAAHLSEGYVGIMADHSPFGLIVPTTILVFFQSPEDFYVRWPAATFLRFIRMLGAIIAMLLPALYIAIVNYHQEMLPSAITWAFAASREAVPIPTAIEVLAGELSFDFIREAGVRVPSTIGPTIGIVGALLIGQAAVNASLMTPEVVIVVAITAIAGFTTPNLDAANFERIMKYAFILAASLMGFMGVGAGLFALGVYLCSLRSFGVPFMAPLVPLRFGSDVLVRSPMWKMDKRPSFLRPEKQIRQPPISRPWTIRPGSRPKGEG